MIILARIAQKNAEGRPNSSLGDLGTTQFVGSFLELLAGGPTGQPVLINHDARRSIGFVTGLSIDGSWLCAKIRVTSDKYHVHVGWPVSIGISVDHSYFDDKTGFYRVTAGSLEHVSLLTEGTPAFAGARVTMVQGEVPKPEPEPAKQPEGASSLSSIKGYGHSQGSFGGKVTSMD